jgi:hypothetical protein
MLFRPSIDGQSGSCRETIQTGQASCQMSKSVLFKYFDPGANGTSFARLTKDASDDKFGGW